MQMLPLCVRIPQIIPGSNVRRPFENFLGVPLCQAGTKIHQTMNILKRNTLGDKLALLLLMTRMHER